jgi:hypothetical protein
MLQDSKSLDARLSRFTGLLQVALFRLMRAPNAARGGARAGWGVAAILVLGWGGGCASTPPGPPKPPEPAVAPSTDVKADDAWRDAKLVAGREAGRTPAAGAGSSMQPVYGDNTMLVISPIEYDQLRPGMTVAYVNQRGGRVVHRLVQKLADGWQVIGLNNDRVDDDVVTRKNLLGVVYATFNTTDESPEKERKP